MALLDAYYEMEELVKKSFLYTEEKIEQFKENNVEQQTLRQIVEEQSIQLIQKDKKIREQEREISKDADGMNEMSDMAS